MIKVLPVKSALSMVRSRGQRPFSSGYSLPRLDVVNGNDIPALLRYINWVF